MAVGGKAIELRRARLSPLLHGVVGKPWRFVVGIDISSCKGLWRWFRGKAVGHDVSLSLQRAERAINERSRTIGGVEVGGSTLNFYVSFHWSRRDSFEVRGSLSGKGKSSVVSSAPSPDFSFSAPGAQSS